MAIRTFNSVGGFSVGELPTSVILANGDVTTDNARFTTTVNIGNLVIGNGNLTVGNTITAGNIRTDHLLYANGVAWDLQEAQGSNGYIQYNDGANNFGASSNLVFYSANNQLATVNFNATANIVGANIFANNLTDGRLVISNNGHQLLDSANLKFDSSTDTLQVNNFHSSGDAVIGGNLTVQGSLTSLETTNTTIEDNIVVLNKGETGSSVSSGTSGFQIDRGTGTATSLLWTESANAWVFTYGSGNANLQAGHLNLSAGANITGNVDVTANLTAGNITSNVYGNIYGTILSTSIANQGVDTTVLFNDGTLIKGASGITYNKSSNLVTFGGNVSVGNVTNLSNVVFSTGGYILGTSANTVSINAPGSGGKVELKYDDGSNHSTLIANTNGIYFDVTNSSTLKFDTDGNLVGSGNLTFNSGLITGNSLYINQGSNVRGDSTFGGNLTISANTVISGNILIGNSTAKTNANISGDTYIGGNANIVGALVIGNLQVRNYVTSNLIPGTPGDGATHVGYDLGSQTNPWKDLWLSGSSIKLGTATISSTGTGSVTTTDQIVTGNLFAGNLQTYGDAIIGNVTNPANLLVWGTSTLSNSNVSTDVNTGALVVTGGVGIGGNINVGGIANIGGNVIIGTLAAPKNANVSGSLTVGSDTSVGGNLDIAGNLTVNGTTTYINVTNIDSKDPVISLGGSGNANDLTGTVTGDRGLLLRNYYSGSASNQFFGWSTANREFEILSGVTLTNEVATGTYANLHLGNLITSNLYGRIETANQPNVANMSGLFDIHVSNVANINIATISNLYASGLQYPLSDYGSTPGLGEVLVLKTDGAGTLAFTPINKGILSNGTSNVYAYNNGNVVTTIGGATTFTVHNTGANLVGNLNVTGYVNLGNITVGQINPTTIKIGNSSIRSSTITTTATTAGQVIAEVDASTCRGVEFFVKGEDTTALKYTIATVACVHDGTNISYDVYGTVNIGGYVGKLSANYSGGKVQLIVTPSSTNSILWTTQYKTI
jgi:NDP-sugar pyrophosphorylase family protein